MFFIIYNTIYFHKMDNKNDVGVAKFLSLLGILFAIMIVVVIICIAL